ncbi:uncharacterized protein TEOVI_000713600 [Trypanosoma equiperdum]|uniref:Uncharacterized protein n=1 Tax=Trypanosoma equiperdum TaxID=5694 RepID=A0A1G4I343_TRYEQ|nr:hypothetical protein, conserved [Trypanosoma equiperdum]
MHNSRSTIEMGFCSVHRRKRARADLVPLDNNPGHMRCKNHKECRQRTEVELVLCSVHNRRRSITQMKEVRKGVFECLPQHTCRGQFNDSGIQSPAPPSSNANAVASSYGIPQRGSRPQQGPREHHPAPTVSVAWAPTSSRSRHDNLVGSSDWAQVDRKTWCARHGKLTSQCELVKDCCYVCYDESTCLSTALELASDLMAKGCKELLCSKHNSLRLLEFLERTPDKLGYQCVAGHRCRGTLDSCRESAPERGAHPTRDAVSSFFI